MLSSLRAGLGRHGLRVLSSLRSGLRCGRRGLRALSSLRSGLGRRGLCALSSLRSGLRRGLRALSLLRSGVGRCGLRALSSLRSGLPAAGCVCSTRCALDSAALWTPLRSGLGRCGLRALSSLRSGQGRCGLRVLNPFDVCCDRGMAEVSRVLVYGVVGGGIHGDLRCAPLPGGGDSDVYMSMRTGEK